jgi:HSP20 family protein
VSSPIPGVDPEAIEVKLDDDVLTISAEVNETRNDENERTLIRERRYGKFSRSLRFGLPVEGDKIEADYTNGVLKVHVPKAEASQPKKISVKYSK